MVVWVFSGGGETEVSGLIPFLQANYPFLSFERKTPARKKPGAKPNRLPTHQYSGSTGDALGDQIEEILPVAYLQGSCDVIFVLDDLDCHNADERRTTFRNIFQNIPVATDAYILIGFATPEIESWLIADWEHTFRSDYELRTGNMVLRYQLAQNGVDFEHPEHFSHFDSDKDACAQKLSDLIIAEVFEASNVRYSKSDHSARLLKKVQAPLISPKCPEFRVIHTGLSQFRDAHIGN